MSVATVRPPKYGMCPDCGAVAERKRLFMRETGRYEWTYACWRFLECKWEGQPTRLYERGQVPA